MKTILGTLLIASTLFSSELRRDLRRPIATPAVPYRLSLTAEPTAEQVTITLTILAEARGEGKEGMYAVACVIQQRMKQRKACGITICTANRQFSCWNNGRPSVKLLNKSKQHSYALRLAKHISAGKELDRKYVGFADHYCTLKTNPYWAKGEKPVKIVGNHKFFKLN